MTKQKWTTEPPTVDGYYWVIRRGVQWENGPVAEMVELTGNTVYDTYSGRYANTSPLVFSHWFGPLVEPEMPQ